MDLLYDSIETILNDDLNNIVDIIIDKYGYLNDSITKQQLQTEFPLESISVVKEFKQKISKPHTIPTEKRCIARTWGGKESVKYDEINNNWNYGYQCKRTAFENNECCKIHMKSLTHGKITMEPPHFHYEKYKKKLNL